MPKDTLAPPTFVVTHEQYNRMARLVDKKVPVKVRVNLQAECSKDNQDGQNIVGEIPGGAKKDEVVMIGAHFDSWHTGTGATDNGAGSAVMIEVMRILKTLNLKMDRTVRHRAVERGRRRPVGLEGICEGALWRSGDHEADRRARQAFRLLQFG